MATPVPAAPVSRPAPSWVAAALGVAVGLIVLGPGLRSGLLLNLDLSATPELRVPPGIWGLGPPLTQRVPLGALEAWVATALGGPLTVKVLIVASIAGAYAGMERLVREASVLARHGVALIYAAGPFTVTRAAIGQLNVLWAVALLPWLLPTFLRPSKLPRRTFVALFLLGLGGTASAVLGLVVVAAGLVTERHRRLVPVAGLTALASLPWLVPDVMVLILGASVEGAGTFRTDIGDPVGLVRVLAGAGFWVPINQVGGQGAGAVAGGLVLVALAVVGHRALPAVWARGALITAMTGLVLALASGVGGLRSAIDLLAGTPVGSPFRESQRFLLLWLVVALPAAAHGADLLAARLRTTLQPVAAAVPLALGLILAAPGALGAEEAFSPRHLPPSWEAAAEIIGERPGTTLVLPWHLYYRASFADGRNILNPGPDVIGGDTISSFDPEVGGGEEQLGTRPAEATKILDQYRAHRAGADRLARLGVRWVFVPQEFDWAVAGLAMADDPGLVPVTVGDGVLLYEVEGWHGPMRTPSGRGAPVDGPVAPLRTAPASGGTWAFPGTGGWLRGLEPVPVDRAGLLEVPAGSGPLWYWPAVPILLGDVAALAGLAWALRSRSTPEQG